VNKRFSVGSLSKSGMSIAGAALLATMGGFVLAAQASAADNGAAATAAPAPAATVDSSDDPMPGQELFLDWGCGSCHTLAAVGADGHVGPVFDGDPNLTKDFIVNRVTYGQGAMPGFGGQMTDKEIGEVADYLLKAAAKPSPSSGS